LVVTLLGTQRIVLAGQVEILSGTLRTVTLRRIGIALEVVVRSRVIAEVVLLLRPLHIELGSLRLVAVVRVTLSLLVVALFSALGVVAVVRVTLSLLVVSLLRALGIVAEVVLRVAAVVLLRALRIVAEVVLRA